MNRTTLTVDRVLDFDDHEMYNLADRYLKGRFASYAATPEDQETLEERELPTSDRSDEYKDLWDEVKSEVREILYNPEVILKYRTSLQKTQHAVEKQLDDHSRDNASWERGARGFLNMVKDELARVQMSLDDVLEARRQRDILLEAIRHHRRVVDSDEYDGVDDEADDRLWRIADQIMEEVS